MNQFTVKNWVNLFQQIGLTDDQMTKWHQLFEDQHPNAHQSFLEWLGLDATRVAEIRKQGK